MLDPPETRPLLDSEEFADDSAQIDSGTLRNIESITIPETATYGRYLTWSNVYLLILSQCFGSGIFATPGAVVQSTGSIGLTLLAWAVGASISAIDLAGCIEYGCMFPRSGGDQLYLEFTYRRPRFLASTLYATTIVLFSSSSSDCFVFSKYTLFALGLEATVAKQRLFALGLLVVTISIHGCFLKPGIWIQNFLGWVNILVAVLMVITSLFVVAFQQGPDAGYPSLSSLFSWDHLWHGSNWQLSNFSVALLKVYNIFLAMCSPNYILNEVQNPIGTLKTVGPAAWLTVVIFYALILFAYLSVLPISIIKNSGELVATRFFERVLGHGLGKIILPLIIAGSAAGNVMSTIFISARYFRCDPNLRLIFSE
ncbi:hypothetical protein FQN57_002330 [Myotisia sp. PD_48]|nr:hypothetical protein FQN57_002330 [Myotisia sp. PD_48]